MTTKPGCTGSNIVLNMPDGEAGFLINPLNWKTDETPAPLSFNKGSMELGDDNSIKIVPGKSDAKINLARGVIECSTSASVSCAKRKMRVKRWKQLWK